MIWCERKGTQASISATSQLLVAQPPPLVALVRGVAGLGNGLLESSLAQQLRVTPPLQLLVAPRVTPPLVLPLVLEPSLAQQPQPLALVLPLVLAWLVLMGAVGLAGAISRLPCMQRCTATALLLHPMQLALRPGTVPVVVLPLPVLALPVLPLPVLALPLRVLVREGNAAVEPMRPQETGVGADGSAGKPRGGLKSNRSHPLQARPRPRPRPRPPRSNPPWQPLTASPWHAPETPRLRYVPSGQLVAARSRTLVPPHRAWLPSVHWAPC